MSFGGPSFGDPIRFKIGGVFVVAYGDRRRRMYHMIVPVSEGGGTIFSAKIKSGNLTAAAAAAADQPRIGTATTKSTAQVRAVSQYVSLCRNQGAGHGGVGRRILLWNQDGRNNCCRC